MATSHVVALFGASGRTGLAVIEAARRRNWSVHALVRPSSAAPADSPAVRVTRGDIDSTQALAAVLPGASAAVTVFGPRPPYTDVFCARATELLIAAMRQHGPRRLIVQTGAQVGIDLPNWSWPVRAMSRAFARSRPQIAADFREQERLVRASGLDWTIVKPPLLTNGPPRGNVRIGPELRIGLMSRIRRADLAEAILDEVEEPRHVGRAVFVVG
jgi:putative NADH-flavin reductase